MGESWWLEMVMPLWQRGMKFTSDKGGPAFRWMSLISPVSRRIEGRLFETSERSMAKRSCFLREMPSLPRSSNPERCGPGPRPGSTLTEDGSRSRETLLFATNQAKADGLRSVELILAEIPPQLLQRPPSPRVRFSMPVLNLAMAVTSWFGRTDTPSLMVWPMCAPPQAQAVSLRDRVPPSTLTTCSTVSCSDRTAISFWIPRIS